jgi:hypothetical protein
MHNADEQRPAAATPDRGSPGGAKWRIDEAFLLLMMAGFLVARIPVLPHRIFDPDELQHAHGAWCVFRGMLPYKDFFEHHTPWYYFTLSQFFRWFRVDESLESATQFLLFARGVSLLLTTLSLLLVFRVGRLWGNRKIGMLAALFLLAQPVFLQKAIEIRPDVLAFPFFLGGLWFLLRGLDGEALSSKRSLRWFFGGGLCLGAAIMCTQKMLFLLPGAFAGLGFWCLAGWGRRFFGRVVSVLASLAGVAVPGALTWAGFAARGGGRQFIANNFLLNSKWNVRVGEQLVLVLETGWPILILGLLGATVSMYLFFGARRSVPAEEAQPDRNPRERGRYGDVLLISTLGGLVAGILVMPVAHRQYYLMLLPIVALFAARGCWFLVEFARERARPWILVAAILPLLVWPVLDLQTAFASRNDGQIARLRYVFEHTRPSDVVMDGWEGTGVFRPHAFRYFFLHDELLAMLPEHDRDAYLDALERGQIRPRLITLDDELVTLGSRFVRFVRSNYQSEDGLFYLPKPGRD